ncbi:MAG TPA: ARMT1-like domain-containing protein [Syntrophorhabdaceae bacterium]|jgi:hypothetical protein
MTLELQRECKDCIVDWVYKRTEPYVREDQRPLLSPKIVRALEDGRTVSSNVGFLCNEAVFSAQEVESGCLSYYTAFKEEVNRRAEGLLSLARSYIGHGANPEERLERAVFIAAAANVSSLGAPSVFTFPEIEAIITGLELPVMIGDAYEAILRSRRILYITDNAGEVGFDSLVIELLKKKGCHVTLVVKEEPFFEDARMGDATYFGLDQVADEIISTHGFFIKNTGDPVLDRAFQLCDLIMAKGTGSYEALSGETIGKRAIFMLKVKCGPISRETGVAQGRVLVKVDT